MSKYSIGIDYGSLSGRALLVDLSTGKEVAVSVMDYPHGVMSEKLPCGVELEKNSALQHPQDYLDVLEFVVNDVIKKSNINPLDVVGLGVDFTACTPLPVTEDGQPLCFEEKYKCNPHAYVKLWKHHAAQKQADKINLVLEQECPELLKYFGGKVLSEWLHPKALELLEKAPEIYNEMTYFIEAGDWIVYKLCNKYTRNNCAAGYKGLYMKETGFLNEDILEKFNADFKGFNSKLGEVYQSGSCAGNLTEEMAKKLNLHTGVAVAVATIDAHAGVPAVGMKESDNLLMIMGTSTCHLLLSDKRMPVKGISGVVEDGIIPNFFGYEAGQCCVGDHFQWLVENLVPQKYFEDAKAEGMNIHKYLAKLAGAKDVGESGLIALDWWNGVRTPLGDSDLKGMILGMTLKTKVEDIYRTLIEATAFGTKKIIETFETQGVAINDLVACGGIADKDAFMMQIYADVLNKEIKLGESSQTVALGSAIFGANASKDSGYNSLDEIIEKVGKVKDKVYKPNKDNVLKYEMLYEKYNTVFELFADKYKKVFM